MSEKPIIRHCENCEYGHMRRDKWGEEKHYCDVRYKFTSMPRVRACICDYYKPEGK